MEVAVLRLVHIACGLFWAGGAVTVGFWVLPAVVAAGPAGGAVMRGVVVDRKLPQVMTVAGLLTVLAGLRLYQLKFSVPWVGTPEGLVLTLGGLLAIGGLIIGVGFQRPTSMRLADLAAQVAATGGPPTPAQAEQLAALQKRSVKLGKVLGWHLGVAALLMASLRLVQALSSG